MGKPSAEAAAKRDCGKCGRRRVCLYRLTVGAALRRVCRGCHEDAKPKQKCRVCGEKKLRVSGGVCKACKVAQRTKATCSRCAREGVLCSLRKGQRVCVPCRWRLDLKADGVVNLKWEHTPREYAALCREHATTLAQRADLWILPCGPCLYYQIRAILWTEFGIFAGLVQGPPISAHPRQGGVAGRKAYAAHLKRLKNDGCWPPPGSAKVLVACADAKHMDAVRKLLPLAWRDAAGARLVPFAATLSRQGLSYAALKARAETALSALGLESNGPRSLRTGSGSGVFCDLFYPPTLRE
jgi:hypothetical protein